MKREKLKWRHHKNEITNAKHRSGVTRSGEKGAVMALERRGGIVWSELKRDRLILQIGGLLFIVLGIYIWNFGIDLQEKFWPKSYFETVSNFEKIWTPRIMSLLMLGFGLFGVSYKVWERILPPFKDDLDNTIHRLAIKSHKKENRSKKLEYFTPRQYEKIPKRYK